MNIDKKFVGDVVNKTFDMFKYQGKAIHSVYKQFFNEHFAPLANKLSENSRQVLVKLLRSAENI